MSRSLTQAAEAQFQQLPRSGAAAGVFETQPQRLLLSLSGSSSRAPGPLQDIVPLGLFDGLSHRP